MRGRERGELRIVGGSVKVRGRGGEERGVKVLRTHWTSQQQRTFQRR